MPVTADRVIAAYRRTNLRPAQVTGTYDKLAAGGERVSCAGPLAALYIASADNFVEQKRRFLLLAFVLPHEAVRRALADGLCVSGHYVTGFCAAFNESHESTCTPDFAEGYNDGAAVLAALRAVPELAPGARLD